MSTHRTVVALTRYASRLNSQCAGMCGIQVSVARRHAMRVELVAAILLNVTNPRPTPSSTRRKGNSYDRIAR